MRSFVADCQMALACSLFVAAHGVELLRRNLYRNYVLHLVSLYEFGVVSGGVVHSNIAQLQALLVTAVTLSHCWLDFGKSLLAGF